MDKKPDSVIQVSFNPAHLRAMQEFTASIREAAGLFRDFLKSPGLFQGEVPENLPGKGLGVSGDVVSGKGD